MPARQPSAAEIRESHGFVRVAAVSPELVLGHPGKNAVIMAKEAARLASEGCRVIVFPELSLTGYSCGDLFHTQALQKQALDALMAFCDATHDLAAVCIVGLPIEIENRLYNAAAVVFGGTVHGLVPKSFLPNSAEFYERRWFSPAGTLAATTTRLGDIATGVPVGTDLLFSLWNAPRCTFGVELCEDLWTVNPPSGQLALAGATIIVNPSASTELLGKAAYRRSLVAQQSARCLAAYVYAGAGPGESSTDVIYSGHCMIAENGGMLAESKRFNFGTEVVIADIDIEHLVHERQRSACFRDEPCLLVPRMRYFDFEGREIKIKDATLRRPLTPHPFVPHAKADRNAVCEEIFAIQSTALARRLRQTQSKTAVIGLSGGLDSTLAMLVMLDAVKRAKLPACKILAVTMPGFGTTKRTRGNAEKLAEALGIELRTISINDAVRQHFKDIGHAESVHDATYENSQARERTQILMDLANKTGGIVVGTGDLSEAALGWCTFNGDHMSMYHVNAGVPKTLVRYLIEWCAEGPFAAKAGDILRDIADTPITPELLPLNDDKSLKQKTEDTIGPYELHDFFLFHFLRHGSEAAKIKWLAEIAFKGRHKPAVIAKWLAIFFKRFAQNQFKRSSMPDGPKVGTVALSPRGDWRMPSDFSGDLSL
ncbi:MAG: NAD(+) synthase [Verrucomicrobiaceae bacterium]|nr:NAD(+) synthase [Verrucomicrobiaceae bacterium]